MPEIPGLDIEDPERRQPQRLAKGVLAEQLTGRANVLGGSELHELAEFGRATASTAGSHQA